MPGGERRQDVVGYGATYQRGVEVLDSLDYLGQYPERVLRGVDALVVLGVEVRGDRAGGQQVWRICEADGEGLELLAALLVPAGSDGGDEAGVEAAGEKDANGHVPHHLAPDGLYKTATNLLQYLIRNPGARLARPVEVFQLVSGRDGCGELHEAAFRGPVVARREGLDVGLPAFVERAHLRREADEAVAACPVQRLYADGVAGCDKSALLSSDQEREHPEQFREGAGFTFGDQTQCYLVVRAGAHVAVFERLPDLLVVVHLAVADQVEVAVWRSERLLATLYVDDGEPPVAEHVPRNLDAPFVVRPPVDDASQHPRGGLRVHAPISADDSAHVTPFYSGRRIDVAPEGMRISLPVRARALQSASPRVLRTNVASGHARCRGQPGRRRIPPPWPRSP